MSSPAPRDRLREQTRQASSRHAEMRARLARRSGEPAAPGDVFAVDAGGDLASEWVILARDPDGRVLAVPADGLSFAGSADVEISDAAPAGFMVLRCRLGAWLTADVFDPAARTGVLDSGDVARAWRRWSEVEAGELTATILASEVDEDPEYEDWVNEVLLPARRALLRRTKSARPPVRRRSLRHRPLALIAASIAIVVTAGLAVRLADLDRRLDEARRGSAVVNPVIAVLEPPSEVRGAGGEIVIPERASHVILFLPLRGATSSPEYRIEISVAESGQEIWTGEGLAPERPGEIRAGVPAALLPAGEYRLRLLGREDGELRLAMEYVMNVRRRQ